MGTTHGDYFYGDIPLYAPYDGSGDHGSMKKRQVKSLSRPLTARQLKIFPELWYSAMVLSHGERMR